MHEFCKTYEKPREKISQIEREFMKMEILNRTKAQVSPVKQERFGDPLSFIPNYELKLEQALSCVPNAFNKILLQICWKNLPFFRNNFNLLLTADVTFIRQTVNPKGLLVHMHRENEEDSSSIWAYNLIDNPNTQEIKLVNIKLPKENP